MEQLRAELKETESARQKEQAVQEALKEVHSMPRIPQDEAVNSWSYRRFGNFVTTSTKELERKMRPLPSSNLRSRYVHVIWSLHGGTSFNNRQGTFDVRRFLRGELEELPLMPNPVVVTGEGKPRFKGVRHYQLSKPLLGLIFH